MCPAVICYKNNKSYLTLCFDIQQTRCNHIPCIQVFFFSFPEITSQSHHIGSMLGGLRLRVYVDYFELGGSSHSSYALAKVYVGGK